MAPVALGCYRNLFGNRPHKAGKLTGNGPGDDVGVFAACPQAPVAPTEPDLGLPTDVLFTFRTPEAVIKRIFLMVFWPRRGHNSGRMDSSKAKQVTRVLCGRDVCRPYPPLSTCTPSTICPLLRPTPTNWALSA